MTKTSRTAALVAGVALAAGMGAPAAQASPVMTTSTTAAAASVSGVQARGRSVVRDAKWERAVMSELNTIRRKRGMRPVSTSACLSKAVQPVAARSAKARHATTWTSADTRRIGRCVPAGHYYEVSYAYGGGSRTARDWAARAAKVSRGRFLNKKQTTGGAAVYRDTAGRTWVAAVQLYRK